MIPPNNLTWTTCLGLDEEPEPKRYGFPVMEEPLG